MALPKKASRKIQVNNRQYLWMVRKVQGANGMGERRLRLTVQDPQTMELHQRHFPAYTGNFDPDTNEPLPNSVTTADVREFIITKF